MTQNSKQSQNKIIKKSVSDFHNSCNVKENKDCGPVSPRSNKTTSFGAGRPCIKINIPNALSQYLNSKH